MNFQELTIKDPKNVMIDYNHFSACEMIPVALDKTDGWTTSHHFPTIGTLNYLNQLKSADPKIRENPTMRTILHACNEDFYLYLLPTQDFIATPGFSFCMNPSIRKKFAEHLRKIKKIEVDFVKNQQK